MNKSTVEYFQRVTDGAPSDFRELRLTAYVGDGEDLQTSVQNVANIVHGVLSGKPIQTTAFSKSEPVVTEKMTKAKPVEEKKETSKTSAPAETPKSEKAEPPKSEEKPQADTKKAEEKVAKPETIRTQNKPKAGKEEGYDRALDTHKDLIGEWLDSEFPPKKEGEEAAWRDKEQLKKVGVVSRAMVGKPFRTSEGNVADAFKAEFLEELKKLG
jgi:hypothetical protein